MHILQAIEGAMPDSFCSALYIAASADNECRSCCSAALDCSGEYTLAYQSIYTHTELYTTPGSEKKRYRPGLLCSLSKMVSLLLEVLIGGCQGGMPQDEVPNLVKLICTLQHTFQVVLIPASRKTLHIYMAWAKQHQNWHWLLCFADSWHCWHHIKTGTGSFRCQLFSHAILYHSSWKLAALNSLECKTYPTSMSQHASQNQARRRLYLMLRCSSC